MSAFEQMAAMGHEQVVFTRNEETGLRAIIGQAIAEAIRPVTGDIGTLAGRIDELQRRASGEGGRGVLHVVGVGRGVGPADVVHGRPAAAGAADGG